MKFLEFLAVTAGAIIFCKLLAVLGFMLFFRVKAGEKVRDSQRLQQWMETVSERKLVKVSAGIYLLAAALSSAAACAVLMLLDFGYAVEISLVMYILRIAITWLRFRKSGRAYVASQIKKIHQEASGR